MTKVAFDVDDTLIIPAKATDNFRDVPHYPNIALLQWFQRHGHHVIVWSGGGVDYAKTWCDKLGIQPDEVVKKGSKDVDIAFDDADVDLGSVNVKVKRVNNSIVRYPEKV